MPDRTPRADSKSDTEVAKAAGAASSEVSHKAQTDVNAEEGISSQNLRSLVGYDSNVKNLDNMGQQIIQNAITQANVIVTNANETANMVAKQAVRHTDLAIDREWNLDEQSLAAVAILGRALERLNNPTPPKDG